LRYPFFPARDKAHQDTTTLQAHRGRALYSIPEEGIPDWIGLLHCDLPLRKIADYRATGTSDVFVANRHNPVEQGVFIILNL